MGKPLGSATRILAGLFNSVTKSRRKICLDTLRDDRAKQAFERVPPSEDALFGEDLDAVLARMKHISQLNLSNNRSSFSYVPTQPFQPQPRAASTSYSFQKGSKQVFSKSKSSRNFKDNFPTRKGTGSKQKGSNRNRFPFSSRKFTKLFRTMDQNYEQSFSTECYSGSQNPVSYSASHSISPRFKVFKYPPPARTFDGPGSTVFTREECYYRGRSRIPRFLFKDISGSQKRWWSTSSYKFAPLESICRQENIQNGHFEICKRNSSYRGLGSNSGYQRRLFSHTHPHEIKKIFEVPVEKEGLSICGTPLWPVLSTKSFYSGVQGFDSILSKERYQGDCVSRQYSCSGKIIQGMSAKQRSGLKTSKTTAVPAKPQEVIPNSISGIYLFGPPMEHQNNASFPSIRKDSRFETNSTANSFQNPDNLSSSHEVLREGKSCGSSRSKGTSAFQNFSEAIDFHLKKSVRPFQVVHSFRDGQRGSYLVGKPKRTLLHNVPSRTTSTDCGRIRCILHRVGLPFMRENLRVASGSGRSQFLIT